MSKPLTRDEFEAIVDCIGDYSDPHDNERKDKVMAEYDRLVATCEHLGNVIDCLRDDKDRLVTENSAVRSENRDIHNTNTVLQERIRNLVAENERLRLLNLRARNHLAAIRAVLLTLADNYEYLLGVNSISMTEKMKDVRLHIINDARNLIEANIDYNPPENSPALEEKK